jgi:hypothetical protein
VFKESYFQGTEEPKKYKKEKAPLNQPRFKEPFYKNYDLYDTEGVDGEPEHGPGSGLYSHMKDYKSVKDFLDKKRNKTNKVAERMICLYNLVKNSFDNNFIDFPTDEQIKSSPILADKGSYLDSIPMGGVYDKGMANPDFEGKPASSLLHGRDYTEYVTKEQIEELQNLLYELKNKQLTPKEPDIYGLPQGIIPTEDLDMLNEKYNNYGTTNSGNTLYEKM